MSLRDRVERVVYGPEPVRWCSELIAEDPTVRLAVDNLSPSVLSEVADESDTKEEFRERVLDNW